MEVLVTGGDTELGRAIAEGFRDAGHRVVITGARRDELEVAAKELDVDALVVDNTDPATLARPGRSSRTTSTRSSTCPPPLERRRSAHLHPGAARGRVAQRSRRDRCWRRC